MAVPDKNPPSRAQQVAREDDRIAAGLDGAPRFSTGTRPVLRFVHGRQGDDGKMRRLIGQATAPLGDALDYCLCTHGIDAPRARAILERAARPVEWRPIRASDTPALAERLAAAGMAAERFGQWWRWFPGRIRAQAAEIIVDGADLPTALLGRIAAWLAGKPIRPWTGAATEGHDWRLLCLPTGLDLASDLAHLLEHQGGQAKGDGAGEAAASAAIFKLRGIAPIIAGEAERQPPEAGQRDGATIASGAGITSLDIVKRFAWLGNSGQWGIPGWSIDPRHAARIVEFARSFAGRKALELGTSRGHLRAALATVGCDLTTVDHRDRGAAANLAGLGVRVVVAGAAHFMENAKERYDLIVADFHGNSPADWASFAPLLRRRLAPSGTLIVNNAALSRLAEWHEETGVQWLLENLPPGWKAELHLDPLPGIAIITSV